MSEKLIYNKNINPKVCWSMLKTLLSDSKIPCIPPLIVDDQFVVDFHKKAEMFNEYFSKQCSIIQNGSSLPNEMETWTNKTLTSIDFSEDDIYKIIKKLDTNNAHGYDMISIRMLKLCRVSICKPLKIIFKNFISNGFFPNDWKKANVVPIHKKNNKQVVSNYRPISVLLICSKLLEKNDF